MTDEAKAKRAEYMRQWRAANKDREREYKRRYWEKKAGQGDEWHGQERQTEKTSA